jgi:hypothetical protein
MSAVAVLGLAIMVASEAATLAQIEPFWSWNTPIAWTGFIIFADAIAYRARGNSWIRSSPREFVALALVSIPLWLVFEWFNLFLRNWHYVGLPENMALRYFGYAWSFATIWPAIFEGAELIGVLRAGNAGKAATIAAPPVPPVPPAPPAHPAPWIPLGAVMLASPFLLPGMAMYLAAPVWLGFIFLLDPINARLGGESLLLDWRARRFDRTINLIGSGFLCGLLWELWNYWSRSKWHYTVPIMEDLKIFEMPVPGYFGFPAFALECFTMYVFVRLLWVRLLPPTLRGFGVTGKPDATGLNKTGAPRPAAAGTIEPGTMDVLGRPIAL